MAFKFYIFKNFKNKRRGGRKTSGCRGLERRKGLTASSRGSGTILDDTVIEQTGRGVVGKTHSTLSTASRPESELETPVNHYVSISEVK